MDLLPAILLSVASFQAGFLLCLFLVLTIAVVLLTATSENQKRQVHFARPVHAEPISVRPANQTAAAGIRRLLLNLDQGWEHNTVLSLTSSQWSKYVTWLRKSLSKVLDRLE